MSNFNRIVIIFGSIQNLKFQNINFSLIKSFTFANLKINAKNMENREELTRKVNNVIEQIRPYLQADGGDIELVEITADNVVNVSLQGACHSCPMSTITLKNGVEAAMIKAIPEIKSVEAV